MLINTETEATDLLIKISQSKHVTYDTETSGLDWKVHHIVGHVITLGPEKEDTYYVPVRHATPGNLPGCTVPATEDGWDGTTHWFEDKLMSMLNVMPHIAFHNGSFDLSFMHRIGFRATNQRLEDTMINCYLINELRPSLSLEMCCKDEGAPAKKGQELYDYIGATFQLAKNKQGKWDSRSTMGHFWRTDPRVEIVWDYASGDGTSTYVLLQKTTPKLKKVYHTSPDGTEYTLAKVHDIECRLIPVLHRARMLGVKVDVPKMEQLYGEIEAEYEAAWNDIGNINVRSPREMKDLLTSKGITDWPLTDKGNASFREDWLMESEIGRSVVKTRKFRNLMSSFLNPIKERFLYNGRVHAQYHQTRGEDFGTKTGRMSCTEPNLTAQPGKRQRDMGRRFREVYIPDTGKLWCSSDFSNCEIRIAAHYCQAKVWIDGFNATPPIDPHTSVATEVGIPRPHAKTVNLGLMTGMGKGALAADLGMSLAEGSAVVDKYFEGLPELKQFQNDAKFNFAKRGFVVTLLGRRLNLDDHRFAYKAVNRLTQGGNADIIKTKMVEIGEEFINDDGLDLLLSIHDDLNWQSDCEKKDQRVCDIMVDVNNEYIQMDVPMKTDLGRGKNWSEATFYE